MSGRLGSLGLLERVALAAVPLQELVPKVEDKDISPRDAFRDGIDLLYANVLPAGLRDLPQARRVEVDRRRVDVVEARGVATEGGDEVRVEEGEKR